MGCTSSQEYVSPHELPSRRTFSEPSGFGSSLPTEPYSTLPSIPELPSPRNPPYGQVCRQKFIAKISVIA